MNLQKAMDQVIDKISFSKEDYAICYGDAAEIEKKFVSSFRKLTSLFDNLFAGNSLLSTASFKKGNKFDMVHDFQIFLPYKLPCKVKPIFRHNDCSNFLLLKSKEKHPFVKHNFVSAETMQAQLSTYMEHTLMEIPSIHCGKGSRTYMLSWRQSNIETKIYGFTLFAEQKLDDPNNKTHPIIIRFDFIPAPKFLFYDSPLPNSIAENVVGARYWMIICSLKSDDGSVFGKITPRWQLLKQHEKINLRNEVRLFQVIALKLDDEAFLDVAAQKIELFWRVQEKDLQYANMPSAVVFMSLLSKLLKYFKTNLESIAEEMLNEDFLNLSQKIKEVYTILKKHRSAENVDVEEIYKAFGVADN